MAELAKIKLSRGQALEFILAVPGRRYSEFAQTLAPLHAKACAVKQDVMQDIVQETRWQDLRLVVAHHPLRAQEQTKLRRERIAALQALAKQWAGKLDGQDAGVMAKGRKLSDSGAKARLYHEVCEAHLARIVKLDLKSELFSYSVDEQALVQAELMDGKLLLVTNVPDLKPEQVVQRYKAWTAKSEFSPEAALAQLRRIQRHSVSINQANPLQGISTINDTQANVLAALRLKRPVQDRQLKLL